MLLNLLGCNFATVPQICWLVGDVMGGTKFIINKRIKIFFFVFIVMHVIDNFR